MNPKYPIYIISKGRWESRLTSKALEYMNVPYHIVIEPQEYDMYSKVIDEDKILVLPFKNLERGSIPARNWVLDDSRAKGFKRHWILDDNIRGFKRFNNNLQVRVSSGTIFKAAEDFVDRYKNVVISGFQYDFFAKANFQVPVYGLNTRVYSCILIDNNIKHRWRGKYNEDTDLCLRVLKDGDCTILFYAFLQEKSATMTMKGGNTEEVYGKGRLKFAESLVDQHPDLVRVTWKFGRWHHQVNYRPFQKNKLIRKENIIIKKGINNYGMVLKKILLVVKE